MLSTSHTQGRSRARLGSALETLSSRVAGPVLDLLLPLSCAVCGREGQLLCSACEPSLPSAGAALLLHLRLARPARGLLPLHRLAAGHRSHRGAVPVRGHGAGDGPRLQVRQPQGRRANPGCAAGRPSET